MGQDIYNLVTVNDSMTDSASIVGVFSEMAAGRLKNDLRLLNYFNEIPVNYASTIKTVELDSLELAVHEYQALIMKQDNHTLIKSKHFHKELGVHCHATHVSIPRRTVRLHDFAYAQIRAERREAVRVKVHGKLPVTFSSENVHIEGDTVDISGNGISIVTDLVSLMDLGQPGLLSLTLSGTPVAVPGSFVRSVTNENRNFYLFRMMPDRRSDNIIGQFINQRQVEIIQQLKEGLIVE